MSQGLAWGDRGGGDWADGGILLDALAAKPQAAPAHRGGGGKAAGIPATAPGGEPGTRSPWPPFVAATPPTSAPPTDPLPPVSPRHLPGTTLSHRAHPLLTAPPRGRHCVTPPHPPFSEEETEAQSVVKHNARPQHRQSRGSLVGSQPLPAASREAQNPDFERNLKQLTWLPGNGLPQAQGGRAHQREPNPSQGSD